jgi:hypothetical protein
MCEAYAACKADYEAALKVWAHDQTPRNRAKLNRAVATYDYAAHVVSEIAPRLLADREALVGMVALLAEIVQEAIDDVDVDYWYGRAFDALARPDIAALLREGERGEGEGR